MSAEKIDELSHILAAVYPDQDPPYADHKGLYETIDSIPHGNVKWQSFAVSYTGEHPEGTEIPAWKSASYEVWYRDPLLVMEQQIGNPDFSGSMDFAPKQVYDKNDKRQYSDMMSGNWAWDHAVRPISFSVGHPLIIHLMQDALAEDPANHGATLAPIILGSDKTTVSVGTGNNEFYPLYASTGLVHNNVRRAHRNALSVIGFLAIPKSMSVVLQT
jgi:hypothetical protein